MVEEFYHETLWYNSQRCPSVGIKHCHSQAFSIIDELSTSNIDQGENSWALRKNWTPNHPGWNSPGVRKCQSDLFHHGDAPNSCDRPAPGRKLCARESRGKNLESRIAVGLKGTIAPPASTEHGVSSIFRGWQDDSPKQPGCMRP